MNNKRRDVLDEIKTIVEEAREKLEAVKDEEQNCFDNMPESLQSSERGQISEAAIEALDDAITSVDEALEKIVEAIG